MKAHLGVFLAVCFAPWNTNVWGLKDPRQVTRWDFDGKQIHLLSSARPEILDKEGRRTQSSCSVSRDVPLVDWGLTLPSDAKGTECEGGDLCRDFGVAKVVVSYEGHCQRISWSTNSLTELKDCVNLIGHWYGGGQQFSQPWPMETNPRREVPYVTSDMLGNHATYGGVSERFWVSSEGIAARVEDSVPLFLSIPDNNHDETADQMCFSAHYKQPYVAEHVDSTPHLTYYLCHDDDLRQVYESSFGKFFQVPEGIPDERMITHPIWSTWAEYMTEVNSSRVLQLATTIQEKGFNNSQIEIDDDWETCYGDAKFNPEKFPDPKGMVDTLHAMDFRVTLWIHPFINKDCQSFDYADQNGFFLKDENERTQLTSWWQGRHAGLIDFTNEDAVTWWTKRLQDLKIQTGIDSFKFDAGETSYMPENYTLNLNKKYWPNGFSTAYVNAVFKFGKMIEVRVGYNTQEKPVFVRMLDKDSKWQENNGLRSLIPSLLHSGLVGYPFVLPDMVGGNAYTFKPNTELFIRWAQANTFMPSIQFSLLPWNFDEQFQGIDVTEISKDVSSLHTQFSPLIIELAQNASRGVGPMMRPTWWLCPLLEDCLTASQQFLLGDDVLVTPVVHEGASTLDVIFPPGIWRRPDSGTIYEGPSKVTISDISLDSNIYFVRSK